MSKFKKTICIFLSFIILCTPLLFTACSAETENSAGVSVVCTVFPQYDWVKEITNGAGADVKLLLDSGVDLHSYQPTAADIVAVSNCDMFIYVGGESDEWVGEVLQSIPSSSTVVINLLNILGTDAKEEEAVEGMEADADDDGGEYDEHVWLSLRNAQRFCSHIAEQLAALDSANAALYEQNADEYIAELAALDKEYETAVGAAAGDTLLFCDRFAFRYLTDDYSLNYYAAFSGCSAETEASFETIRFLAGKIGELQLNAVIILDGSDGSIAKTVIETAGRENIQILTLNSMQSVTQEDISSGASYLGIMQKNLETLAAALG